MSTRTLAIGGVLAVTFGVGVGTGFLLTSDPSRLEGSIKTSVTGSTSSFFSTPTAQANEQNNVLLSSRIRELEQELTDPQQRRRATMADRVAFFKKYRGQISIEPFTNGLHVTDEMAALLDLSPEERSGVEQHLAETKAALDKIQDADTVLSKQTDTSVNYDISADKEGDALKDRLRSLLTSDIGTDRTDIFMSVGPYAYSSVFENFLADKREVAIRWKDENNQRTFTVQLTTGTGSYTTSSTQLQPEFQKYLPEGMKP